MICTFFVLKYNNMEYITVKGDTREKLGKKWARAARKEGLIPCVLYGGDEVLHFTTTHSQVKALVYTPAFKVTKLAVNGQTIDCILQDIQFHPVTDAIVHIDFLRLVEGQAIKLQVPVRFVGASPGVKLGGKLQQKLRRIKIKTTPENMVDALELDVSKLEMGHSIRVRDIKELEGIEIMQAPGTPVATVEVPRSMRSAEAGAVGEEEGEEVPEEEGEEGGEE
jgi:large subunit ribosomal protein L25